MPRTHGNRQKHESANPVQARLIAGFHRCIVDLVRDVGPRSVLDVGCGEGYVLQALRDGGIGAALGGIDRSPDAIEEARARLGPGVDLQVGDVTDLVPGEDGHDLVMMLEVLEHLEDPGAMLAVLGGLSRSAVLVSVPWEPWFRAANLARLKNVRALGNDPEHIQHWTRRGFVREVARHLTVRRTVTAFPWTVVLAAP